MSRKELKFQNHIIDSYKHCGGMAKKWASEWQAGPPDLVASLPDFGIHLIEVKHRPSFGNKNIAIENPMTGLQQKTAKDYINAGGRVFLAIIRGDKALNSQITYVDPRLRYISPSECVFYDYKIGYKFPIKEILEGAS